MHDNKLIVDQRVRPTWTERRDDEGVMPAGGPRGSQIVRSRGGRRATDEKPKVWPVAAPWMKANQPLGPAPSGPYRMPSGQLING